MKFSELSNKDRYRIIRMGVQNGIHSVSDIEHIFDEGGHLYDGNSMLSQQLMPKKLTDYNQGDWSAIYDKQQAVNNARLTAAQAEWDKMHDEVVNNPDAYDPVDVYKYIGKRPEVVQDINRNERFESDAKVANAIGVATVATPYVAAYAPQVLTNQMVQPIAKSMMAGMGADAVSELATGKPVAEHTKDAIQFATGLNPRNNAVSNFIVDTFGNPFYGFTNETARGFVNASKRIYNNTSGTIKQMSKKEIETAWQKAVDAGDMAEAQRLRDLHFKVSAPNTKVNVPVWSSSEKPFNVFDLSHFGQTDSGFFGYGHYLTPNEKYAASYHPVNREFYVNMENPYIGGNDEYFNRVQYVKDRLEKRKEDVMRNLRNGKLTNFSKKLGINENTSLEEAEHLVDKYIKDETVKWNNKYVKYADEFEGKDGVLSWRELQGNPNKQEGIYKEVVVPKGEQIKLADAVTYDDAGNIIPLSKRDNFNINDIRYSLLPITGIGIGAKLISNNE